MKNIRRALFLPPAIYELVSRAAKKNKRTMVAEVEVRFQSAPIKKTDYAS